jgi:hypothetical protein
MRKWLLGILVTGVALSAAAERRQEAAYPTIAKDQVRPVVVQKSRPGDVTANFNNDPCSIDPSWCGYDDPDPSGRNCPKLCQPDSCGTRIGNQRCLAGGRLGQPEEYMCAPAAGRWCDSYTSPTTGKYICLTCASQ